MPEAPEQKARREIDGKLIASGWLVQDRADLDLTAGRGIAVREFPMKTGFGFADYLLYLDRKALGAVEAKAEGTLTGVEAQSAKYAAGLPDNLPAHRRPLPFLFESNGSVTFFTNGLDPKPRSRKIFSFPRPETCAESLSQLYQLRARLTHLPRLDETGLWKVQAQAISNLEASFAKADPRALIQMATGSGKTYTAVSAAYRLLKFGGAKRVLFLVDRGNLGKQAEDEFANYTPTDDTRKFPTLYTVQRLKNNSINPAAKVVITTIQRLYSMLKGEAEFDAENEEGSGFDSAKPWKGEPPDVVYNAGIPPEFFDFVIVDECHRSIYELWAQVILYFDSFLVGLTATPAGKTIGFFNQNLVMQYGHDEAVTDGVNVDFDVYRIRTRITEQGATVIADDSGVYVDKRHKLTRAERLEKLVQDLTYTASELDRDVVSESQLRTVIRQFRDKVIPDAFPDRKEVPKTLIFAKDDSHADDIVRMVRDEFAEKNDFCEKITYRTGFTRVEKDILNDDGTPALKADGTPEKRTEWVKTSSLSPDEILANFRNSYYPRIAVTVDMISTGTDVKPIECVFFLRNVKSAAFFEQMKGRGVRIISPDRLKVVSPSAKAKERFIIVDAVGICEQDKTDSHTLNRKPSATLPELLEYVAQGGTDPDALTTLAGRLARLQRDFAPAQLTELRELAGGKSLPDLAGDLMRAVDPDAQMAAAKQLPGVTGEPTPAQIETATEHLAQQAVTPFLKAAFRRRILEMRAQNEQTIDRHSIDDVLYAGFDAAAVDKAQAKVQDFRAWIAANKDQLTALQILYAGTKPLKLSLKDLRQLKEALSIPPLAASPTQLWRAFLAVESEKVRGLGGSQLADLVTLVRHALIPDFTLVPYAEEVRARYDTWLAERDAARIFTPEQREWLDRMAEHIATSLAIDADDFQDGWFGQHGSLGKAHALFGDKLKPLLAELNERLAA
ncbi:MAG: DEAD/DEAH box helicase family protein [Gammaproteobacteria bacterium]|nr:DEAD/DEAH box helicase family protein [Gammaproteobacteria bacterium]